LRDKLAKSLDWQSSRDHGEMMRATALRRATEEGRPWEINPVALIDTPQSVPADERRRILLNSIQADRRR
jgi:hypothetical protein